MAIYHYNEKFISRSQNQSLSASVAYVLKEKVNDERYEKVRDYSDKQKEVIASGIILPNGMPLKTPEELANEIEKFEKSTNAHLAKRINFALPIELTHEQQIELTKDFLNSLKNEGRAVIWALHDKDGINPHIDAIASIRPWDSKNQKWGAKSKQIFLLDENGNRIPSENPKSRNKYKRRNEQFESREKLDNHRKVLEQITNEHLHKAGIFDQDVSCETLEKQKSNAELMAKDENLTEEQRENFREKVELLNRIPLQRESRGHNKENKIINKLIRKDLEDKKKKIRERKNLKKQIRDKYWRNKFAKNQTYIFKNYKEAKKAFPKISKDLFATKSFKHQFQKMEKRQGVELDTKSRSEIVSDIINKSTNPAAVSVSESGQLKLHALPANSELLKAIEVNERSGGGGVLQMPNNDDENKFLDWNLASEFTKAKLKRKAILKNV